MQSRARSSAKQDVFPGHEPRETQAGQVPEAM